MIVYSPFWETLKKSNESWYSLTNKHHMSSSTLHRLKHNRDVSTKTLNDLCRILDCQIKDIVLYVPSDTDQIL
ncbi:MAG: helix-turn-helix domain-containing protein [Lachnospiraceae bacterium]|nr:helix-turn-helix domain-containing protein [Lachnospiraceae bacterium]MDE6983770.1 helix-turn-helix domain-containing protein [Lachnospiraceae bacterium]MDE7030088.1 helix-turn-helix domain-containing protein [Lachnospiraceae bacterium]